MYIYICVYIYIYICIYICIYIYIYIFFNFFLFFYVCMNVLIHIYIYRVNPRLFLPSREEEADTETELAKAVAAVHHTSSLRRGCLWIATHARFDKAIIACILLNLVRLVASLSNF